MREQHIPTQSKAGLSHANQIWWRRDTTTLLRLGLVAVLIALGFVYLEQQAPRSSAPASLSCSNVPPQGQESRSAVASSVLTIEQAYNCILDTYPANPPLDNRLLLRSAMSGLVNYLVQQNIDQNTALLPALTGNRSADWQAFAQVYSSITAHLRTSETLQQGLATAAIVEMVNSLHDDHAAYIPASDFTASGPSVGPDEVVGLGIHFSDEELTHAVPPLFIVAIDPESPAEQAGLHPGDTIVSVNGITPFVQQQPIPEVMDWLFNMTPKQLQIYRPDSDQVLSLRLTPTAYPAIPIVSSHMLTGNIIYIHLRSFNRPAFNTILVTLRDIGLDRIKGMLLDLRGNSGGEPNEQGRIISMFVHNKILASFMDRQGQRTEQQTDNTVSLLHIPLVALTDRICASACDAAAADIHDLHLGRLVGERTAGEVSGPAGNFFLNDGSALKLPNSFMYGPNGEIVDGIGVPPDDEVQLTPADLAAGKDPVLNRGIQEIQAEH